MLNFKDALIQSCPTSPINCAKNKLSNVSNIIFVLNMMCGAIDANWLNL